eukprot:5723923-Ditylum_brightwellii.AAC.1
MLNKALELVAAEFDIECSSYFANDGISLEMVDIKVQLNEGKPMTAVSNSKVEIEALVVYALNSNEGIFIGIQ